MRIFNFLFVLAGIFCTTLMHAQENSRIDPCDAMPRDPAAAKAFFSFDQFDKELRVALSRQDPLLVSLLVKFPLVVNDEGGSISINDPHALQTHFQEVFTPAVRKEILDDKAEKTGCLEAGLDYGRGVIWVNASKRGYAIEVVNRDAVPPYSIKSRWELPQIQFLCQTQTHRIVIDSMKDGTVRYRSWDKPRPLTDKPDLELLKGDGSFEGTQVCATPIYTFTAGKTVYRVEGGLGCYEEEPPKDATGRLQVSIDDKPVTQAWCY